MISVVIPFLDEERALDSTLAALFASGSDIETIAVDGASRDRSREVLSRHPQVVLIEAARGRAEQMNAGAAIARGELLLFLHADTVLPQAALPSLAMQLSEGTIQWGGFRQSFCDSDWRLRSISRLHNWRCRLTRVFYGDQAMFVRRSLFELVGGFPPGPMEDIALSERLRPHAPPVLLDLTVTTDSRKFVQMGVWRAFAHVLAILACRALGWRHPTAFFADYR
jgi:rSAM/selenodomain-associated transferase 2